MVDITAIILTKNEEKNIVGCIKSITTFAQRILVIDSGSTDDTCDLAEAMGAEVYTHPFENYSKQFNWGIDNLNITTKWILRLDADEQFTPKLCKELEDAMTLHENDDINGFTLEAWLYFMGKRLTHGKGRKRKLMVFKTGIGRIEERNMDEHTILSHGTSLPIKEKFIHNDFKDIDTYVKKLNWYASREVQDYLEFNFNKNFSECGNKKIESKRKKKTMYYKAPMFLRCWLYYLYMMFIKGNILNGREGMTYSFLYHLYYRLLVDAKIYEYKKQMTAKDER